MHFKVSSRENKKIECQGFKGYGGLSYHDFII